MANKVNVWFDAEADFLEVRFGSTTSMIANQFEKGRRLYEGDGPRCRDGTGRR